VRSTRTTRCCSATALTLLCSLAIDARAQQARPFPTPRPHRTKTDSTPLSLFPLRQLWKLELNTDLKASMAPVFDKTRAFFPIDGGRVVAYDLVTGRQTWIVSLAPTSRPAASPDLLFVVQPMSIDAVRVEDGSTAWQLPFAETLVSPLVWDNGWLVAVTLEGDVLAFRASDGHLVWRQNIRSPAHAPPALSADRVYVPTEDGRVVALHVETGALIWEHRLGGAASDILALDERLYVGSKDNFFYCLSTKDGEQAWRFPTGGDVIGLPLVDEHSVYFVSLDNVVRALNRGNGNQRWRRALSLRPTTGPIRAGETIIVTGLAETLPAFAAKDGSNAGELTPGGEVVAPPHILEVPGIYGPVVIAIARDIVKGATVTAHAREIEPTILTSISLPNLVTFTPAATKPAIPQP
jgi:outer membrane protein assembly factor BamB